MSAERNESWKLMEALGGIDPRFVEEARCVSFGDNMDQTEARSANGKKALRRVIPKALLVAAAIAIPAGAWAGSELTETIRAKCANINVSEQELQEMADDAASKHITPENLKKFDEIRINEDGLTYGLGLKGVDLGLAMTDDGKMGYVYQSDLYASLDDTPEQKYYKMTHTRKLAVYESDGKTVIGYLRFGWLYPEGY